MRNRSLFFCGAGAVLLALSAVAALAQAPVPIKLNSDYSISNRFPVPGDGDWDYIAIDSGARRLYVSHGDLIQVLNADSGKLLGQIPAPGAHGVALAPQQHRGYTSNGGNKSVTVFDTESLAVLGNVKVEPGTDGIVYDPFSKRVFALSETPTAIDTTTNEIAGTVNLGSAPEGAVADGKGTLYVALPKTASIAVVDTKALSVARTYSTKPCGNPRTVALDSANQQLLIGCSDRFVVLDANTGKLIGGSLQCSGVDSGAYDPDDKLIFESCSEGVITVMRQMTKTNIRIVATIPTQIWARTMAFDPITKNIYLPVSDFEFVQTNDPEGRPNRIWKSGTFQVLVATRK